MADLLAGRFFLGGNVQDSVRIDIEGHFDLRLASPHHRDAFEIEHSEIFIVPCKLPFSLGDMDGDCSLVICCGREDIFFLGWDSGVSWDHNMRQSSFHFDRQ